MQSFSDLYKLTSSSALATAQLSMAIAGNADNVSASNVDLSSIEAEIADLQLMAASASNDIAALNVRTMNISLISALAMNPAARKFTVTTAGNAYVFDGLSLSVNPQVHLISGHTYIFNLNGNLNGHPFIIRNVSGGSALTMGFVYVDNNGNITSDAAANVGHITGYLFWTVPVDQSSCVYQCTVHGSMVGNIIIKNISTLNDAVLG